MALDFSVWWASHFGREFSAKKQEQAVVIDSCLWPQVGFSCEDKSHLFTLLEGLFQ
jgi:hypothetical protein